MKFQWTPLCMAGAIASPIPDPTAHEVHLPYLPSLEPQHLTNAYLSIKWTTHDGSLYANNDGNHRIPLTKEDIQLYYSLKTLPVPASDNRAPNDVLRITVELIDKEGRPVIPHAVAVDLHDHPNGTHCITGIQLGSPCSLRRPKLWQMEFWKTQANALLNHHQPELSSSCANFLQSSIPKWQTTQSKGTTKSSSNSQSKFTSTPESESQVGYIVSPYGSTYIVSSNKGHHLDHHENSFTRLVRPVILPAMLGIGAGLLACMASFCVGHLIISFARRLRFYKRGDSQNRDSRSRPACLEEGHRTKKLSS